MKGLGEQIYGFGDFRLDPVNRQLRRDGEPVSLPAKAFDLLHTLIENRGRLVEKNEIFERVWRDQIVEESNLTVQISAIRKALGETKKNPRFIETVPGYGYRFVGDVINSPDEEIVIETETRARFTIEREETYDAEKTPAKEESVNNQAKPSRLTNGSSPAELQTSNLKFRDENLPEISGRQLVIAEEGKTKSEKRTKTFLSNHRFFAGALVLTLLLVGGFGSWFYDSRPENRNAAIPFADAKVRQLTTKGNVGWAALSPDGKFYAYSLNERGEFAQSLWLKQTDGGNEIQLRPSGGIYGRTAFSPDGRTLYFTVRIAEQAAQNGLFKMPALGGVAEKLPIDISSFFALSPDGKQIAFTRTNKDSSALIVANLDGTGEREVTTRPLEMAFSSRLTWSPDGERIAIFAANAVKEGGEIFVVSVSDGQAEQLTALDWMQLANLVWRRDGRGLVVVATGKNESIRHLWHVDYPGGRAQRIADNTDSYGSALNFSADGKSLLAVQLKRESNIWMAPAGNLPAARQITFSSINGVFGLSGFDWTADDRIVFTAGIDRSSTLYSMDTGGGDIRQITTPGFYDQRPNVTADGMTIIFQSNRNGATEIWRVGVDGSNLRQLTGGGRNMHPHLTPDGKSVIYTSNRAGKNFLQRVSVEGGEQVQITDQPCSDPRVSPDGKYVACEYQAGGGSPVQLAVLKIEDGAIAKMFDAPRSANFNGGIRWTADGKNVCYRDWRNGIWQQPIEGGAAQRLEGLPAEKIYTYNWSPDGKLFAYTRGREIGDVILISDFD